MFEKAEDGDTGNKKRYWEIVPFFDLRKQEVLFSSFFGSFFLGYLFDDFLDDFLCFLFDWHRLSL
ncbi:MAG: hypothetical protein WC686_05370 [Candidatus Shapirobacteria bacterium]|jgi:hypothetical protein